jgi:hypothetical protein
MAEFMVYHPESEVSGQVMLNSIHAMGRAARSVVNRHIIGELDPNGWYPQQTWLNILRDAAEEMHLDLLAVGNRVAASYQIPDGVFSLARLLEFVDANYQTTHRFTDPVRLTARQIAEREVHIVDNSPYPDEFQYGIFFGLLQQLTPLDATLKIRYDKSAPTRSDGADVTTYIVSW